MKRLAGLVLFIAGLAGGAIWILGPSFGGNPALAQSVAGQAPEVLPGANPAVPGEALCLSEPVHWSAPPKLLEGFQIVHSWFIRFETPDGETIPARIFLVEARPEKLKPPKGAPPPRGVPPGRIICLGHEIEPSEGFAPDFVVAVRYVKSTLPCTYNVNLGSVQAIVRTVSR